MLKFLIGSKQMALVLTTFLGCSPCNNVAVRHAGTVSFPHKTNNICTMDNSNSSSRCSSGHFDDLAIKLAPPPLLDVTSDNRERRHDTMTFLPNHVMFPRDEVFFNTEPEMQDGIDHQSTIPRLSLKPRTIFNSVYDDSSSMFITEGGKYEEVAERINAAPPLFPTLAMPVKRNCPSTPPPLPSSPNGKATSTIDDGNDIPNVRILPRSVLNHLPLSKDYAKKVGADDAIEVYNYMTPPQRKRQVWPDVDFRPKVWIPPMA